MSYKIRFGTDGWRGEIAKTYTFDNVYRCAQGFASYMTGQGKKGDTIIVGHDKRFQSENFARSVAEVLAGNGFRVMLTDGATATPVISYAVVHYKAAGAVNITASHNPPLDNGFKVRDETGGSIYPKGLKEIETLIPGSLNKVKTTPFAEAESLGQVIRFDAAPAYIDHLEKDGLIDLEPIRQAGLNVLVDSMWGNGAGWFPRLLNGAKTRVSEIHNSRNPVFPEMLRPEPIPPNVDVGLRETVRQGADVLVVTDGDGDRIGIGDENGRFINQLEVYGLLAYYMLEVRKERGAIVKTLSTTSMLEELGKIYNVPVHETGVGFKFVAPKMTETGAMIGGEESGGYAFRGNVPERDGILAGLYFLDFMVKMKKKPSELLQMLFDKVGPHYYDRIDSTFTGGRSEREKWIRKANPKTIAGIPVVRLDTSDGYKFWFEDGGWLLIRFSGTEPIMRFYTETTQKDKVQAILKDGLRIAGLG